MPTAEIIQKLNSKKEYLKINISDTRRSLKDIQIPEVEFKDFSLQDIKKYNDEHKEPMDVVNYFRNRSLELLSTNFLAEYLSLENFNKEAEDNPLYGIPISIKEIMAIEGLDSTLGLAKNCQSPKKFTSVIVRVLHHLGAIPFMTTSAAQGGLSIDSSNPVFGTQENPRFKGFLAGGSSGGEGIAISLGASPIGLGSDIGGSIRFPAAFNGICSIKPTYMRLSSIGHIELSDHNPITFRVVVGPLGRRTEDLADFFRAVLCDYHFQLDPTVIPLKFNEELFKPEGKKLRVGFYTSFNEVNYPHTVPSVARTIEKAAQIMEDLGHDVKPFKIPDLDEGLHLAMACLFADGGEGLKEAYKNEIIDPCNEETNSVLLVPRFLRKLFGRIILKSYGKFISSFSSDLCGVDSYLEGAKMEKRAEKYRQKFLEAMDKFDIILCPLFPIPIPMKGTKSLITNVSGVYSFLYNLVDLPAGVLPIDSTTEADNIKAMSMAENFRKHGDVLNESNFSSQTVEGQPLYVQVVGKPFREETVLYAMSELEKKSNYKLKMPF